MAFYSQMDVIRRQLDSSGTSETKGTAASDRYLEEAVEAFRTLAEQDAYAMRLKAETLPVSLDVYPAEFGAAVIRPEDAAAFWTSELGRRMLAASISVRKTLSEPRMRSSCGTKPMSYCISL